MKQLLATLTIAVLTLPGCEGATPAGQQYAAKSAAAVGGALAILRKPAVAPTPAPSPGTSYEADAPEAALIPQPPIPAECDYHCERCNVTYRVLVKEPPGPATITCIRCFGDCPKRLFP